MHDEVTQIRILKDGDKSRIVLDGKDMLDVSRSTLKVTDHLNLTYPAIGYR